MIRKTVIYGGNVQGVGFRFTAQRAAHGRNVTGYIKNRADGCVQLVVEGEPEAVNAFLDTVQKAMATYIGQTQTTPGKATGEFPVFEIRY